jgi:hypothetical protein
LPVVCVSKSLWAVRQLADRRHHVACLGVDYLVRAERLGELAPLGRDVDGDDTRAPDDGGNWVADRPTGP